MWPSHDSISDLIVSRYFCPGPQGFYFRRLTGLVHLRAARQRPHQLLRHFKREMHQMAHGSNPQERAPLCTPIRSFCQAGGISRLSWLRLDTFLITYPIKPLPSILFVFRDKDSLCSSGFPGIHHVDHTRISQRSTCLCIPRAGLKAGVAQAGLKLAI